MLHLKAHAKINLWLRVLAPEAGTGYHQIETAFCRLDLADELVVRASTGPFELVVEGADLGDTRTNLVSRAVHAFCRAADLGPGVSVRLTKNIPAGAGLGGGSSDAAATLHALNRIHGHPLDARTLHRVACGLGADVPFFLSGAGMAIGWGRGDRLMALSPPPPAAVLIVWPGTPISTADAYAALDISPVSVPPFSLAAGDLDDWATIADLAVNDFERVAQRWIPEFDAIRRGLLDEGARFALLAGSGSAVFGIFDSMPADAAAASLRRRFPRAAVLQTRTAAASLTAVDQPSKGS